ncbi:MAG: OmpH family outer membrane protein [Desulfovibrionaceae bacterium]|nr:OmpH family outer membrane protein [Desulfovibrionaceae bacterium]
MKRIFLAALAFPAFLALAGASDAALAADRLSFGVVNLATLYQDSAHGKAGMARLEKLQNDAMARLEALRADLARAQEEKDEAAVQRLQVEIQGAAYTFQGVLSAEQENMVSAMQAALEKSLEQYRGEHKLSAIFSSDTILSFSPDAEVTQGVLALFNKQAVDFGPEPSLELPAAPAGTDSPAPGSPADAAVK